MMQETVSYFRSAYLQYDIQMNIQIDRQKTDMGQVLHICVGSLKDSAAVFVGLVMDQLEKHD